MRNRLLNIAVLTTLLALPLQAQTTSAGTQSSYISVMSKAGTPTPRPNVPVRYVPLPAGARAGSNYYYGNGGYGYGATGGSPSPSYANQPSPSTSGSLPGYDTRPQSGRDSSVNSFGYENRKRRRR